MSEYGVNNPARRGNDGSGRILLMGSWLSSRAASLPFRPETVTGRTVFPLRGVYFIASVLNWLGQWWFGSRTSPRRNTDVSLAGQCSRGRWLIQ